MNRKKSITISSAGQLGTLMLACAFFPAMAASHCAKGEIDYFSCKIKGSEKSVSVCGTTFRDDAEPGISDDAWIQYRFGKPGKPEMTFPEKKQPLQKNFTGEFILANGAKLYALQFKRGQYAYEVLMAPEYNGIIVAAKGKTTKLSCDGSPKTTGGPNMNDFTELVRNLSR